MSNKERCEGTCANDCFQCGRYFSSHSSHYDSYYDCRIVEISCSVGGNRIFKDEDGDTRRLA